MLLSTTWWQLSCCPGLRNHTWNPEGEIEKGKESQVLPLGSTKRCVLELEGWSVSELKCFKTWNLLNFFLLSWFCAKLHVQNWCDGEVHGPGGDFGNNISSDGPCNAKCGGSHSAFDVYPFWSKKSRLHRHSEELICCFLLVQQWHFMWAIVFNCK